MKKTEKVGSHPLEAFFEALVSSSDDAILSKDLNGIVVTWNEGAERMFGYTANDIVGRSITKLFPPDRLAEEQILMERIRRGERISHYETVRRRKDGSNVYVSVTISPIKDADGNIIGASKIARDISDQKEAQERLRLTLSCIGDAVISTDVAGRVTFMNPVAETLTGWTRRDAIGKPLNSIFEIVNEAGRHPVESPVMKVLQEGVVVGLANHTVLIAKDGVERPIDDSAAPIRGSSGEMLGVVLVFRDVSDRRTAQMTALRLQAIIEGSDDAIIGKDLNGIVTDWNPAAERIFGYSATEMIGRPISILFPPDRLHEEPEILARLQRGERVEHFETIRIRKDGRRLHISLTISPIKDEEGHVIGASKIARDITKRKAVEQELQAAEAQLKAHAKELEIKVAERTAALQNLMQKQEAFYANVSHELRTPLSLILGPLEKLISEYGEDKKLRAHLDTMARNARTLLKHVDDLLDVAKLEAGQMNAIYAQADLSRLVRLVASNFETVAQQRQFEFKVEAPEAFEAEFDPDKVQRVLLNLLSNAFKFTPVGGRIRCTLREGAAGRAIVEVADSGPGIPTETRKHAFERFRQLHGPAARRFGGTGLGLAIVHEFVTLHGGTVSIEDAPEGGALFRVTMPRQAPIGADVRASTSNLVAIAETDRPTIEPLDDGGETPTPEMPDERRPLILIVEDNRDMNRFIADSLRSEYRIATAFDGREGLRKAKELRPDLVLTDFMLPEMSGDEMVYALREERSFDSTPVIFLTAKADDAVRINLLRTGAQDYVLKPFSIKELRARIANLVGKKITDERNHVLIDQLQQRQAELDRVAIQLAAANRDLEAFSFSIAHDLHAPLRAIAGFCEVIQSDHAAKLDATAAELLSRVVRNVRRMDEMIDGLLELSKLSRAPLNHAPIKLNELAESIVTELRDSTPQRHVDFVIKPELLAEGDPRLVRILLTNLIGNAWKYTGKQSHARIEVGKTGTNGRNAFYVRDNGVGFDMAHAINLFGVFQRLHRADEFEGNGIGLATAQRIVQRHGGELWVEAETGKGATFYFTLAASPKQ